MKKLLAVICMLAAVCCLMACDQTCDHSYGKWSVKKEATCTEKGTEQRKCKECGEKQTRSLDPIGHNYTEEITTEASCTDSGVKTFTCANCEDTYTEEITYPTYDANQVFEMTKNGVGEIITSDRAGNEYSLGTCFVYSTDGKIITNYHVIENSYSAKVTINGNSYTVSQVLAYDKDIDLAVLKINASGLSALPICTNTHEVGKAVYAFGSSQGLTATFSQGIITYADRELDGVHYVQHDSAISSGNSGGPLIDEHGEVVGINTWTVRDSQNLNFAIVPSELNNLVYGTPLTMAEFYNKECNAYIRLKNYVISNGTRKTSTTGDEYYTITLGSYYTTDGSNEKHTRAAYYFPSSGKLSLDFLINNGDYWAYFELNEDLNGEYHWEYFDEYDNEMYGTLYANTYTDNSLLGYSYTNATATNLKDAIRTLASDMIIRLCEYIDEDLASISVTAEDLGFYHFS